MSQIIAEYIGIFVFFLVTTYTQARSNTIKIDEVKIDIIRPGKCKKVILVLPGYNHSRKNWITKTGLKFYAENQQYCLVLPEMGKSIYSSRYFGHTRRKVLPISTQDWFSTKFFPKMKSRGFFLKKHQKSYILGLSTGARGAVLLAYRFKKKFRAIAALSGDYNQTKMPGDRLMTMVYGSFSRHHDIWAKVDNPFNMAKRWMLPLYLGHSKSDKIVSFLQSYDFFIALQRLGKQNIVWHLDQNLGHTYKYWNSELRSIFNFFEKH